MHVCMLSLSCLTLCDPMNCSPPCSSLYGIFQARILEQVAISYSRGPSYPGIKPVSPRGLWHWQIDSLPLSHLGSLGIQSGMLLNHFSHVRLCATPWTIAHQAPLSMGFPSQAYWSGLPFPTLGDLLGQ